MSEHADSIAELIRGGTVIGVNAVRSWRTDGYFIRTASASACLCHRCWGVRRGAGIEALRGRSAEPRSIQVPPRRCRADAGG